MDIKVGLTIFKARDEAIFAKDVLLLLRDYDRADGDLDECELDDIGRIVIDNHNAAVELVTGRGIRRNFVDDF